MSTPLDEARSYLDNQHAAGADEQLAVIEQMVEEGLDALADAAMFGASERRRS